MRTAQARHRTLTFPVVHRRCPVVLQRRRQLGGCRGRAVPELEEVGENREVQQVLARVPA